MSVASANVDVLLSRLDGVQKSGPGWRAKCPNCTGRSRKLSVSVSDDGRILCHCFAGCEALAVVQAVGLSLVDLFPERIKDDTPDGRRKLRRAAREAQWGAALEMLEREASVIAAAARDLLNDGPLDWDDFARVAQAQQRIADAARVLRS